MVAMSGRRDRSLIGIVSRTRLFGALLTLIGVALLFSVASVELDDRDQALLGVATIILFLVINRFPGRLATLMLVMLSLAVSLRYIIWRMTDTLLFRTPLQGTLGTILVIAELYAITVMLLGYAQTVWPLGRRPVPLPDDPQRWPTVDVYIPTYNESLSVVRATVLAALAMDWPREKLRVYLLDDGRRAEFRDFAAECGAGYIIRPDNRHAKAGNLNHALRHTDGEMIAVFDCDHVPTRAFLQMTVGWLVRDSRLALVQTPHHFYSLDPFQRNLRAGTRVPSEGNMFYGLVQDGNDFWNAAFFCGSCAVLRRSALDDIGGFATETVTEDAHTALRLHRAGWQSAYLRIPLAAGLATERLILHVGQRMRWARGMLQILRVDNPLFGRGLSAGQRICYANAMIHFLFAIPRIVFLTSPLAYLLLGQNIIAASPLAIVAYAGPHIIHAVATNSRIQRNWRHSFWSEIYETVLAMFLVRLTVVTLLSPRRGRFNVTDKGGLLSNGYFDMRAVYPNLLLGLVLLAGIGYGLWALAFTHPGRLGVQALALNTIWATFSLLIVAAALAVGRETRQVRTRHRVRAQLPVVIHLPDGRLVGGTTEDVSMGGARVSAAMPEAVTERMRVDVEIDLGDERVLVPGHVLNWEGSGLSLGFDPSGIAEEAALVRAVFGRADAWLDWDRFPEDRVFASLRTVLSSIRGLFRPRGEPLARPVAPATPQPTLARQTLVIRPRGGAVLGIVLALMLATPALAQNGTSGKDVAIRPLPGPVTALPNPAGAAPAPLPDLPPPPVLPADSAPAAPAASAPGQAATTAPAPPALPAPLPPLRPGMRRLVLTLRQLGVPGPMTMRGTSPIQGVLFGVRADEVVVGAELTLNGALSPALIPEFSNVTVTLNEQYVGTIPAQRDQPRFGPVGMVLNPVFFQDNNRLNFRFTGRYTTDCNDPLSGLLWATVSDTSTLTLTLQRLPAQRDLARLPLPFFDPHETTRLVLPFVLPAAAPDGTLQAAAIAASWFGGLAGYRGADFPVRTSLPEQGNAVLLLVGQARPAGIDLPAFTGPTAAVLPNPTDPFGSVLVIGGRTEEEAVTAATVLALGAPAVSGKVAQLQAPDVPPRQPYDAPAWIPAGRKVRLGELVNPSELQVEGYAPGTIRVPFATAPDLYTWRQRPFPVNLRFRAPPGPVLDVATSRLDVLVNGAYLTSFPLASEESSWTSLLRRLGIDPTPQVHTALIPPYDVFGRNELQLSFDARPLNRGSCGAIPGAPHMAVDPASSIDLSRAYRFTEMPNLAFMVSAGFPFTRMADLSETAALLPEQPQPAEIAAFLRLMGQFGAATGYPALRLRVVRPSTLEAAKDRDIVAIGTIAGLAPAADLFRGAALGIDGGRLAIHLDQPLAGIRRLLGDRGPADRQKAGTLISATPTAETALMLGAESPFTHGRSLVAFLGGSPAALGAMIDSLHDSHLAPSIQGDLAILHGHAITAFRVGDIYTVGSLPFWMWPEYLLRGRPILMMGLMLVATIMLAVAAYWALRRRAAGRVQDRRRGP
jgi:cellulose synthase (UDP-forming)